MNSPFNVTVLSVDALEERWCPARTNIPPYQPPPPPPMGTPIVISPLPPPPGGTYSGRA